MWTCTSPAPPGPPPTAKSTSPSSSASPTATAPTSANANRQPHPLRSPRNRCHRTRSPNTKPQIHTLIEARLIQMELFTAEVCEVQQDGVRYVLRRHPIRAAQLAASRADKQTSVEQLRQDLNGYLDKHPRAQPATAERAVRAKIAQLKIQAWLQVETEARALKLSVNQAALEEAARLDGCYVIQTDLPESAASKQAVHDCYQDLAQVEQAFRNCKNHAPGNPAHSRANGGTHPRSRPGGDAGLPDSAGTGPRLDFAGRYRRRGTAPIAHSALDGSAGGRRGGVASESPRRTPIRGLC